MPCAMLLTPHELCKPESAFIAATAPSLFGNTMTVPFDMLTCVQAHGSVRCNEL